jgi:putative ABC transport system permease protein
VVGDVRAESLGGEPAVAVYYPVVHNPNTPGNWGFWWPGTMSLAVKTGLPDPMSVMPSLRQAIADVDPEVPLTNLQELQTVIDASMAQLTFASLLLALAAATALLLAAVGLYGVVSYAVTRRTREIGMRLAVGARPREVEWMIVAQTLGLAAAGLVVGTIGAWGTTRVLEGLLYEVEPTDPKAFAAAALVLLGVTLLASWLPAQRAARVDPSEALRSE